MAEVRAAFTLPTPSTPHACPRRTAGQRRCGAEPARRGYAKHTATDVRSLFQERTFLPRVVTHPAGPWARARHTGAPARPGWPPSPPAGARPTRGQTRRAPERETGGTALSVARARESQDEGEAGGRATVTPSRANSARCSSDTLKKRRGRARVQRKKKERVERREERGERREGEATHCEASCDRLRAGDGCRRSADAARRAAAANMASAERRSGIFGILRNYFHTTCRFIACVQARQRPGARRFLRGQAMLVVAASSTFLTPHSAPPSQYVRGNASHQH